MNLDDKREYARVFTRIVYKYAEHAAAFSRKVGMSPSNVALACRGKRVFRASSHAKLAALLEPEELHLLMDLAGQIDKSAWIPEEGLEQPCSAQDPNWKIRDKIEADRASCLIAQGIDYDTIRDSKLYTQLRDEVFYKTF